MSSHKSSTEPKKKKHAISATISVRGVVSSHGVCEEQLSAQQKTLKVPL